MNAEEAQTYLESRINVSDGDIAAAKALIVSSHAVSCAGLREQIVIDAGLTETKVVPLYEEDPRPAIDRIARRISLELAMIHAVWDLVRAGIVFPGTEPQAVDFKVGYTTVTQNRGGHSGGFDVRARMTCPRDIIWPRWRDAREPALFDGDLFLKSGGLEALPPGVEAALREALTCFRHDLFTPTLAMLVAALEGAWIECGQALVAVAPNDSKAVKTKAALEDPYVGIGRKIASVCDLYDRTDLFRDVRDHSGVSAADLREVAGWSEIVRESRNVLHWTARTSTPNTSEKVTRLLLGAAMHFKRLNDVEREAK